MKVLVTFIGTSIIREKVGALLQLWKFVRKSYKMWMISILFFKNFEVYFQPCYSFTTIFKDTPEFSKFLLSCEIKTTKLGNFVRSSLNKERTKRKRFGKGSFLLSSPTRRILDMTSFWEDPFFDDEDISYLLLAHRTSITELRVINIKNKCGRGHTTLRIAI